MERALHRFKYEGWRALAPALAGLIAERLPEPVRTAESRCLLAVPLHRRRLRERGYNQSALLAGELRRRWALPDGPGRLVRLRDTAPQVGLDRPARRRNVADAFVWDGPDLAGRAILLVDDVATTGSTLEACGRALKAASAGRVEAVTVARVSA
jgi:ComF family protein